MGGDHGLGDVVVGVVVSVVDWLAVGLLCERLRLIAGLRCGCPACRDTARNVTETTPSSPCPLLAP